MKKLMLVGLALAVTGANLAFAETTHLSTKFSCSDFECHSDSDCTKIDCDSCDQGGGTTLYCNKPI